VKVALLDPGAIDNELGVNVTVPPDVLDSVTVRVASVMLAFPYWSCRCTVIGVEATPAATVTGVLVITSLVAAAALTVSCCVPDVIVLGDVLAAVMVGVPACVSV
jgi:hypothetical protein